VLSIATQGEQCSSTVSTSINLIELMPSANEGRFISQSAFASHFRLLFADTSTKFSTTVIRLVVTCGCYSWVRQISSPLAISMCALTLKSKMPRLHAFRGATRPFRVKAEA
jgi:hypothetical protein